MAGHDEDPKTYEQQLDELVNRLGYDTVREIRAAGLDPQPILCLLVEHWEGEESHNICIAILRYWSQCLRRTVRVI